MFEVGIRRRARSEKDFTRRSAETQRVPRRGHDASRLSVNVSCPYEGKGGGGRILARV
jgi:hypothetical protein